MFGLQEILIVAGIVGLILFLPRMQAQKRRLPETNPLLAVTGKTRLAIAASVLYPLAMVPVLKPWRGDPLVFAYIGLGPVALGWLLRWVWMGFKRK